MIASSNEVCQSHSLLIDLGNATARSIAQARFRFEISRRGAIRLGLSRDVAEELSLESTVRSADLNEARIRSLLYVLYIRILRFWSPLVRFRVKKAASRDARSGCCECFRSRARIFCISCIHLFATVNTLYLRISETNIQTVGRHGDNRRH